MNKGIDLLRDFVFYKNYSQKKEDGNLETWEDSIDRIYSMHEVLLKSKGYNYYMLKPMLDAAKELEKKRKFLSSQRARQFASPNKNSGILKHNSKLYNCCSTLIDRPKVFSEIMYLLLSGCGVGYSLHKEHINKLPLLNNNIIIDKDNIFSIEDSIEGIAESINVLMNAAFTDGCIPTFLFNNIRAKGSLIDGKFLAPGAEPLKKCISKIIDILISAQGRKLKSVELHRIICFIAESVIAGGVRRSAMISLFDKEDKDMIGIKANNTWYSENKEYTMANNSILTVFGEPLSYTEYKELLEFTKLYGEPGFIKVENYNYTLNPCSEIVMNPVINNKTGFAFCNLVEINAANIENINEFYYICQIASFVATIQSLYTDFKFLDNTTKEIAERDRAIGVSITGLMDNTLLEGKILEFGATIVKDTNVEWANKLNINPCKRCTTIKPSGNATIILGGYCSGVHAIHDTRYIRRVRTTEISPEWIALKDTPLAKYENGEYIISFPIEYNGNGKLKTELSAVEHMKYIGMIKHFWVNKGTNTKIDGTNIPNNVSCTVEVDSNEWDEIKALMYCNSHLYTGVSFLPKYEDTYPNLPYTRLNNEDTIKEYNSLIDYISNNKIDLLAIMSKKDYEESGNMAATACSGGSCEIK